MTGGIDLHVHSRFSDGTFSPKELVRYALAKGLSAFALTDHDTVSGLLEARQAAQDTGLEVIPGVELSTEYKGRDIHILGYYIDEEDPVFLDHLMRFKNAREIRNQKMCALLQEAGIDISVKKLKSRCPDAAITRAHYAKYLLDHGYVKEMKTAFQKYLGDHTPYFVPREKVTPKEAVSLIQKAGGVPVLAHPILYHMDEAGLTALVETLSKTGLAGIETYYSTYKEKDTRLIKELAKAFGLLCTGGSDFHGSVKPDIDLGTGYGSLYIPPTILKELKDEHKRRQENSVH